MLTTDITGEPPKSKPKKYSIDWWLEREDLGPEPTPEEEAPRRKEFEKKHPPITLEQLDEMFKIQNWHDPEEVRFAMTYDEERAAQERCRNSDDPEAEFERIVAELKISRAIAPQLYQWRDPHTIPCRQWLYGRHLIRKFCSATVASGGVGKSSRLIVEALELVTGETLISDRHNLPPVAVWYWNGEDPLEEIERRIQAACLHYGIIEADIGDRLFVNSGRDCPIIVAREERGELKIAEPIVEAVKEHVRANQIAVIQIDPFVRCHRVSENNNGAINAVAELWAEIADKGNCAIDLSHHLRKTGGAEAEIEDARGAVALIDAVRHARVLNRMSEKEAGEARVKDNRRLYIKSADGKANLAPPADKCDWFKLESVSLENGDPPDSVQVAIRWQWPDALADIPVEAVREFQNKLGVSEWLSSPRADKWAGKLLADVLGLDLAVDTASTRKVLRRAIDALMQGGAVREVDGRNEDRISRKYLQKGVPV
jgi:hypothetical protein